MLAFLGAKDAVYGALIALLTGCFAYYTIHERRVGEAEVVAADKRTALVAQAKDAAIAEAAQQSLNQIGEVYEKAVVVPSIPDIGLVCQPPRPGKAPPAANGGPKAPSAPALPGAGVFDPSGAILTLLRNDDDQINGLIDTVEILETYIATEK